MLTDFRTGSGSVAQTQDASRALPKTRRLALAIINAMTRWMLNTLPLRALATIPRLLRPSRQGGSTRRSIPRRRSWTAWPGAE
jgi:hypothetical protein